MVPRQTKSRLPNRVATARCWRSWLKARSTVLRSLSAAGPKAGGRPPLLPRRSRWRTWSDGSGNGGFDAAPPHVSADRALSQAYALYEELGSAEGTARVRARLRALGTRLCHWTHQDRPAIGWGSLTDTERTITDLVAQGLSNRQVASRVFLRTHTVAFYLRHVFRKLGVISRVQLARMAAGQTARTSTADV